MRHASWYRRKIGFPPAPVPVMSKPFKEVDEVDEADDKSVKLTGDVVELHREFIQENALSVANLDV